MHITVEVGGVTGVFDKIKGFLRYFADNQEVSTK